MRDPNEAPAPDEAAGAGAWTSGDEASGSDRDGAGNARHKKAGDGSWSADDPERPMWDRDTVLEHEYEYRHADGTYAYSKLKGRRGDGQKVYLTGRRLLGDDVIYAQQDRPHDLYKYSGLTSFLKGAGDEPDLPYRLDELTRAMAERPDDPVFICEGEKDADTLWAQGLIATTNPNGALNWKQEFNFWFADRDVVVLLDNDDKGRRRGSRIVIALRPVAASVKTLELPDLPENGDVTDWLEAGNTVAELLRLANEPEGGVRLSDFHAFMPLHNYIFAPSGESWPSTSVNSRIPPVPMFDRNGNAVLDDDGEQRFIVANKWLDQHRPVEQMTWAPGQPQVIRDQLISDGGWFGRLGEQHLGTGAVARTRADHVAEQCVHKPERIQQRGKSRSTKARTGNWGKRARGHDNLLWKPTNRCRYRQGIFHCPYRPR